jgi:hypothetical protein
MARDEVDELRATVSTQGMSDLDCFIEIIENKLSDDDAKKIWQKA